LKKITKILATLSIIFVFFAASKNANAQMQFIQNKGQWNNNVQYRGDFNSGSFFLENNGFTVMLHQADELARITSHLHAPLDSTSNKISTVANAKSRPAEDNVDTSLILHSVAYKVDFLGATKNFNPTPDKAISSYNNYLIGNDQSKWASNCKIFGAVTYSNIYPNIDVRYYSDAAGRLKYDFIVKPGGNPAIIAMRYDGVKALNVKNKELIISTAVGDVRELYPYCYQPGKGNRATVDCKYVVRDNVVTFQVNNFDSKQTLVIDPSIIFSSFTGSFTDNWGYTATPGPDGSFFAGGIAFSNGYPVSPGAYQQNFGGGPPLSYDIAIFKFSSNGSQKLYATYLGGSGDEQPHSMICDAQGNLVIAGRTNSQNYPGKVSGLRGGYDICITKLNATGTGLIGSAIIGGSGDDGVNVSDKENSVTNVGGLFIRRNYGDDARSEVILDKNNNIYLASCTQSSNFFTTPGVLQSTFSGVQDGVILKLNPNLSTVLFSTFFGGSNYDACFALAINPLTQNLYVVGGTMSDNLPGINNAPVISNSFQGAETDGFITEINATGSSMIATSYLGTIGDDMVYGVQFDRNGFPYIMGTTTGNWVVTSNVVYKDVFANGNYAKQFISKLKPDLSGYVYSTVFGTDATEPNISPTAFLVDRCENVYVSGWGGKGNTGQGYPSAGVFGMPKKDQLNIGVAEDNDNFFFFVLQKDAQSQLFGSYFGQFQGNYPDHVDGGTSRFDKNGVIYQAICANCSGGGAKFPISAGVIGPRNNSSDCNEVALKIEMDFTGVGSEVHSTINGIPDDTSGCVPLKVIFKDVLQRGKKYYWDFGDGRKDTTTSYIDSITYVLTGYYRVMLIAEDSLTCNIRDTSYLTIKAGDNFASLKLTAIKGTPCTSLTYYFTNSSTAVRGSFGPKSFVLDYGDGSAPDTIGLIVNKPHTYATTGNYKVVLHLLDTAFCNSPDTLPITLRVNPLVKAIFTTPAIGCAPYQAIFQNTSTGGTDFLWDFGDGNFSTNPNPNHNYPVPGVFKVRLIATDTSTCNKIDTSAYFTITVLPIPTALFSWAPNPPQANVPVSFTNLSSGASRYEWFFGDGETSTETNPVHEYNATGTYTASLFAYNNGGCVDSFSLAVNVLIDPLLDVPNAFTPAQAGVNSIIFVRGFGIDKMDWKIYNRWGQLVFESTNKRSGWNGTFKGKLLPMDVYTYTLDAVLTDGTKIRRTGDITLLK
jgi:gliding motility-associated-like protein